MIALRQLNPFVWRIITKFGSHCTLVPQVFHSYTCLVSLFCGTIFVQMERMHPAVKYSARNGNVINNQKGRA